METFFSSFVQVHTTMIKTVMKAPQIYFGPVIHKCASNGSIRLDIFSSSPSLWQCKDRHLARNKKGSSFLCAAHICLLTLEMLHAEMITLSDH